MNVNVLIDAIVRQTMVLIAQLATSTGMRAPLAHLANQVFLDLTQELSAQGLSRKVIADMFGMALRSYHAKMQRLTESASHRGQSLWGAVFGHIESKSVISRADLLMRFRYDDTASVKSVLRDLVGNGLISQSGRGDATVYRMITDEEMGAAHASDPRAAARSLVWVVVHRNRPVTREALLDELRMGEEPLDEALKGLIEEDRVHIIEGSDPPQYSSEACVIPVGSQAGWEAALFDHYQALVTSMCAKLESGGSRSAQSDTAGGCTYTIDLWKSHPDLDEVLESLQRIRHSLSDLRKRVESHKMPAGTPPEERIRVIVYAGQSVIGDLEEPGDLDEFQ